MRRVDAGAAHLGHPAAQEREARDVEFALRVVAARPARGLRRQDAVGADGRAREHVAHDEVVAMAVELVLVDAAGTGAQARAQLLAEDAVAQPLRLLDERPVAGDGHCESGGVAGEAGSCGHRVLVCALDCAYGRGAG